MVKKEENQIIIVFLILFAFVNIYFIIAELSPDFSFDRKAKDSRIIVAIGESVKVVMPHVYAQYGSFDDFNCGYREVMGVCREVDYNYGRTDGKEPTITHDVLTNSQAACIYSPLNKESGWFKKKHYYCGDSIGHLGYTSIDPGTNGYCVDGKSATCPPLVTDIH
jgi:hypothetical protein